MILVLSAVNEFFPLLKAPQHWHSLFICLFLKLIHAKSGKLGLKYLGTSVFIDACLVFALPLCPSAF